MMIDSLWFPVLLHLPILAWLLWDRFRTADRWADWVEAHVLPRWLRWSEHGHPVSWLHHAAVTAGAGAYVGLWGWALGFRPSMATFAGCSLAVVLYVVRETFTGWDSADDVGDVAGPLLIALAAGAWAAGFFG